MSVTSDTHQDRKVAAGEAPSLPRPQFNIPTRLSSFILVVLLLGLAEYAARGGHVSRLILPAPSEVVSVLWDGFKSGFLLEHVLSSTYSTLVGFLLGAAIAIGAAGFLATIPALEKILTPFIVAFQSLPKIAIAPLIVLWLGFGDLSKMTIVIVVCFFPIMINALQGFKIRDRNHYELFKSLGATRMQMFFGLRLPHAIPYIFAGLHIGAIFALIGTVVAEFVGTDKGLGYVMLQAKANFDVPSVYACLALLMLMGILLNALMSFLERKVSFWANDVSAMP
ncbi:ABC transporter permease [Bradyrhizobium sp. NP1]|uniref:ABC transporter permease n=1 Tax=Bradyrhizobium sp. NP1 TaxID=3049772 RepID=UPI0025A5E958|nr:ABC transporter permease [Bradyrhizobium sp. NP1]WJR80938.1 ABC transporter permease [Bradyrhizobium sp. NP1]